MLSKVFPRRFNACVDARKDKNVDCKYKITVFV